MGIGDHVFIFSISQKVSPGCHESALLIRSLACEINSIKKLIDFRRMKALLRKQILEPPNVIEYAKQFMQAFQVVLITNATITSALDIMVKYRLAYWDSLILAATLENACPVIYSEDLQDGQQIEK